MNTSGPKEEYVLNTHNVLEYLEKRWNVTTTPTASVEVLRGGVSNFVVRVDGLASPWPSIVLKQARPKLRTQIDWFSRCERIYREAEALRLLKALLPAQAVPDPLFEDRQHYILGLSTITADHVMWKTQLLQGVWNPEIALTLGTWLATIHGSTHQDSDCQQAFGDWSLFDELRIDPFYRHLARNHPAQAPLLNYLIDQMSRHRHCLVLADFSPKNILCYVGGPTLVDFETAHWGDPAFDLGFFLSHLLLKASLNRAPQQAVALVLETFMTTYLQTLESFADNTACRGMLSRVPGHLAACMWARIDGKSPVDYLDSDNLRVRLRLRAQAWLGAMDQLTLHVMLQGYLQDFVSLNVPTVTGDPPP
ncbi:MAG: aminoglycoside phosphotransferase [Planctomycetaceae bacterium]|nr:MAG: aminoglycoside phosphotransferase [Planctomycetaceae bacterium]